MDESPAAGGARGKAERRAERELVAAYHQEELQKLLEHVRRGFEQMDAGEIDAFELDELIHRYKKAAAKLWSYCNSGRAQQTASVLRFLRERGDSPPDWWQEAAPKRA